MKSRKVAGSAIKSLAFFEPNAADKYGNQVIDHLMLVTLENLEGTICTPIDLQKHIKRMFSVGYHVEEIIEAGRRLAARGSIDLIDGVRNEAPRMKIKQESLEVIRKNTTTLETIEERVFLRWKTSLLSKYGLEHNFAERADKIIEGFKVFISKLVMRHGKETVALLYPQETKVKAWINSVKADILEDIKGIEPDIKAYLLIEVASFLEQADTDTKYYLNNLFNSSFIWHLIQIDETGANLIKDVTKGQSLVLDNNILISLLGFDGKDLLESVHGLLEISQKLGYQLVVTTRTIDEFHASLKHKFNKLREHPPLPKALAQLASEVLQDDNVVTAYWKEFGENGLTIQEFIAEKMHLEGIFEKLSIRETNKFRSDIEKSEELLNEVSLLRDICNGAIGTLVAEHDAFHRVFIRKMRKGEKYNFSQAKWWFLTHDTKLPVYARSGKFGSTAIPFCITTSQFVQANRPMLARHESKEEFEESFHQLVTRPYLRTLLQNFPLNSIREKVLGRMARYENIGTEHAIQVLADLSFLNSCTNDLTESEIDEKLEHKFFDMASDLEAEKKRLSESLSEERKKRELAEDHTSETEEKWVEMNTRFLEVSRDIESLKGYKDNAEKLESTVKEVSSERDELKQKLAFVEKKGKERVYAEKREKYIAEGVSKEWKRMPWRLVLVISIGLIMCALFILGEIFDVLIFQKEWGLSETASKVIKGVLGFMTFVIPAVVIIGMDSRTFFWYLVKRKALRVELEQKYKKEYEENNPMES